MLLNVKYHKKKYFWSSLFFCAFSLNLFELRLCLPRLCFLHSYICFVLLFYNISSQWAMLLAAHISLPAVRRGPADRKQPRFRFRKSGWRLGGEKPFKRLPGSPTSNHGLLKNTATSVINWRGSGGSQAGEPRWDRKRWRTFKQVAPSDVEMQNLGRAGKTCGTTLRRVWPARVRFGAQLCRRKLCRTPVKKAPWWFLYSGFKIARL